MKYVAIGSSGYPDGCGSSNLGSGNTPEDAAATAFYNTNGRGAFNVYKKTMLGLKKVKYNRDKAVDSVNAVWDRQEANRKARGY